MKVLVTGAAGFIGMHVCERLLARGDEVIGLDNLNDYYDVSLKQARLARLTRQAGFSFVQLDLANREVMAELFASALPHCVIHLAAQAGVRHSISQPYAYIDSNLTGFAHVLEGCRQSGVAHLVFASSSSVYGGHTHLPFCEHDNVDHPVSLYAATKKANELMAHSYSHLYRMPVTALRFFTVYGPWGRPDMAPFLFTRAIAQGECIQVFNHGNMQRDFTYIDDAVEAVLRVADKPAQANAGFDTAHPDPATSSAPYRVFNIGNSQPMNLLDYIAALEAAVGKPAIKDFLPMQPGDVQATAADTKALDAWVGFKPDTSVNEGTRRFVDWYKNYYAIS
jgi:UDP-glucuronate 4-epimerase